MGHKIIYPHFEKINEWCRFDGRVIFSPCGNCFVWSMCEQLYLPLELGQHILEVLLQVIKMLAQQELQSYLFFIVFPAGLPTAAVVCSDFTRPFLPLLFLGPGIGGVLGATSVPFGSTFMWSSSFSLLCTLLSHFWQVSVTVFTRVCGALLSSAHSGVLSDSQSLALTGDASGVKRTEDDNKESSASKM